MHAHPCTRGQHDRCHRLKMRELSGHVSTLLPFLLTRKRNVKQVNRSPFYFAWPAIVTPPAHGRVGLCGLPSGISSMGAKCASETSLRCCSCAYHCSISGSCRRQSCVTCFSDRDLLLQLWAAVWGLKLHLGREQGANVIHRSPGKERKSAIPVRARCDSEVSSVNLERRGSCTD